jgi:WD40 repeat protein
MKYTNYRNALVFNTLVNNNILIPCVASTVVEYAHELAGNPVSYSEELPFPMHLLAASTNSKFNLVVTNGARLHPCEKYEAPKERAFGVMITCLIGLPNGTFVSGCWGGYISIWDQDASFVIAYWRSSRFKVRALGVLSENLLVSADDHLRIWDLPTKTQISEANMGNVQALCVGHHGKIYASNERGYLCAFTFNSENKSLQKILGIRHGEVILSLAETHRGQLLAGFAGGDVYMWEDVYQGATTVGRCDARVLAIIVLPDGRFVTGCDNDEVQIWDVDGGLVQRLHDGTRHSTLESMEFAVLKTGYLVCANRRFLSVWK